MAFFLGPTQGATTVALLALALAWRQFMAAPERPQRSTAEAAA